MAQHTDPEYLAELEKETEFLNQKGRRGNDRIALKEPGESALVRLVPYQFDARGRWFARLARHWIAHRPYVCTKDTDPAHGGDPDGKCEMCDLIDKLNRDRNRDVSSRAYRMSAVPQYLVMAVMIEHTSAQGQTTKFRGADLKRMRELWLYKESFQDVMTIFKTFLRRTDSKLSILDPIAGCDLYMSKGRRGLRFDREDPLPLAPKSADPEEFLSAVLKSLSWKPDEPVVGDDLEDLMIKIEDICLDKRGSSRDDDRRGGGRDRDDDRRGGGRDEDRRTESRDDDRRASRPVDDDRRASRPADDDRRRPADDDRRSSRPADDDRRSSRPADVDDRRASRPVDDDRRPAARDDDRAPARDVDDRRASRPADDDRRASRPADDDRRPADDDRRPADDDRRPADDDRRPADDDRRPADDDRRPSRDDDRRRPADDDRRSSRSERAPAADHHPDLDEVAPPAGEDLDEDERPRGLRDRPARDDDDPPPPVSRGVTGSRQVAPPPAAVTGAPRPTGRDDKDDDDDGLPEDDKDKAPATAAAAGEIVDKTADAGAPKPTVTSQPRTSSLTDSIRSRVRNHDKTQP